MYDMNDTIIALASGLGRGSIAIIRLSGSNSVSIVNQNFKGKDLRSVEGNTIHFGWIWNKVNEIDQVLVFVFKSPFSYTGEDSVEISCHSNALIIDEIISVLIKQGARLAKPGEFTFRAFMNGKMNLSQAEAVADIINTKSRHGIRNSLRQLNGELNSKIIKFRNQIIDIRTLLETVLDFSVDEEIIDLPKEKILENIKSVETEVKRLSNSYNHAKILSGSITITIIGKTNVGKSTLMNVLLGEERAITSHTPGTTRDIIHEDFIIDDIHFKLIDTAGFRDTPDHIERKGIAKTKAQIAVSDIVLWVIDISEPWQPNLFDQIKMALEEKTDKLILVANKTDLQYDESTLNILRNIGLIYVKTSASNKSGIQNLKRSIITKISKESQKFSDDLIVTNIRQKKVLEGVSKYLQNARKTIKENQGYEFASVDLQEALNLIGEISGETATDDILNKIFSNYCIGK